LSSPWLSIGAEVNSQLVRVFVVSSPAGPAAAAGIAFSEGVPYIVLSKYARPFARDILSSPFVDTGSGKPLAFIYCGRLKRGYGYQLRVRGPGDLNLFCEEVRAILRAAADLDVSVLSIQPQQPEEVYQLEPEEGGGQG